MTPMRKFNGAGKLIPMVDFFLLIILILFSTIGFVRLSEERHASPNQNHPAAVSAADLEKLRRKADRLRSELAEKQAELKRLQEQAREAAASNKAALEEKQLADAIAALEKEIARLQRKIVELEERLSQLRQRENKLRQEIARWEAGGRQQEVEAVELERLQQENSTLAEEIARLERPQVMPVESTPLISFATTRSPVYVAIIQGRIAPVEPPFFDLSEEIVSAANGQFELVTHAKWAQRGESYTEALQSNSVFRQMLQKLQPEEEYLALLVDAVSFETFRSVRQLLRQKEVPFGWEPLLSNEIYFAASGQVIGEDVQ